MKPEVKEKLVSALAQIHSAQAAGSAREVVAEGYLAIDNGLSAILIDHGEGVPRSHPDKLRKARPYLAGILTASGLDYSDLESMLRKWNDARYSNYQASPKDTVEFLRNASQFLWYLNAQFATGDKLTPEQLDEQLATELYGRSWPEIEEIRERVHELWQDEAEEAAVRYGGSTVGNKILNPSNFTTLGVSIDDPVTRHILSSNEKVKEQLVKVLNGFLRTAERIQNERAKETGDPYESTNFTFGVRLGYVAGRADDIANEWGEGMTEALKKLLKELDAKGPETDATL